MAFQNKPLNEILTFSRASGATRVNAAGLIVGVDFSSTSNTITTGSNTFTLTADANVNRDWPVGSSLRAVDQVGGGTTTGTVTSYTPSTQALVLNVTATTGSGTSTNWRIGSLEFRRDFDPVTLAPRGGLVEGQATNLISNSQAVGAAGLIYSSADGITWTDRTATSGTTQVIHEVGFFNGKFYYVGDAQVIYENTATAIVAGTTWTARTPNFASSFRGVATNGTTLLICGSNGAIATSPDGTTWTLRTSGTTNALYSVMYSTRDQQWYSCGDNGTILRSVDAITWENISNDAIGAVIRTGRIQANPALPNLIPNQVNKVAMRIRANDVAVSVNGAPVVKDTQAILPAGLTQLSLGMNGVQGGGFNGWIRDVQVFTSLKDDAFLVSKSTL